MKKKDNDDTKKKVLIVVISAIFLISGVASAVLYRSDFQSDEITVNSSNRMLKFKRVTDTNNNIYYNVNFAGKNLQFFYLPDEVGNIPLEGNFPTILRNSQMFILTFDPAGDDLQYIDYSRYLLGNALSAEGKYVADGITSNSSVYVLPILTCQNSTAYAPAVIFESSNETSIYEKDNCIHVQGRTLDFIRERDRLMYSFYGII
jgi:hypothetical protein